MALSRLTQLWTSKPPEKLEDIASFIGREGLPIWRQERELVNSIINIINNGGTVNNFADLGEMQALDLATSPTTELPDGTFSWVRTLQRMFVLTTTSAAADASKDTFASATPGRLWIGIFTNARYWLQQATWFIHPTLGNDENSGIDSAHPIRTNGELQRRWGMIGRSVKIEQGTTVTIMADMPDGDVMNFDNLFAEDADLDIIGVPTVVASGTFTAVGAINRATPLMQTVTDAALAGGWAAHVGIRFIRIIGGARDGSTAWVMRDLGGGTARTTRFIRKEVDAFAPTSLPPQAGDAYQILQPTKVMVGEIRVQGYNDTLAGGPGVQDVKHTTLIDLFMHSAVENIQITGGGMGFVKLCHVRFDGMRTGGVFLDMHGCLNHDTATTPDRGFRIFGFVYSFGGGSLQGPGGGVGGFIASMGYLHVDMDQLWQGTNAINVEGMLDIGTAAAFDVIAAGGWMIVQESATIRSTPAFDGTDLLWGTDTGGGSGGAINVLGGKMSYVTKPTLNAGLGLGREVRLGGNNLLWTDVPLVDMATTGAIVPRIG